MKVKTINRSEEQQTRERAQDVQKVHRNLDPALHPFEKAKEYTRALNAGGHAQLYSDEHARGLCDVAGWVPAQECGCLRACSDPVQQTGRLAVRCTGSEARCTEAVCTGQPSSWE